MRSRVFFLAVDRDDRGQLLANSTSITITKRHKVTLSARKHSTKTLKNIGKYSWCFSQKPVTCEYQPPVAFVTVVSIMTGESTAVVFGGAKSLFNTRVCTDRVFSMCLSMTQLLWRNPQAVFFLK
ncbi:uncharacterized protein V6R79_024799 [Siganus canaliculatus]